MTTQNTRTPQTPRNPKDMPVQGTAQTAPTRSAIKVSVAAARADIKAVRVVDTDLVLELKSGRSVLIKDGALRAMEETSYLLEFSDQSVLARTFLDEIGVVNFSDGTVWQDKSADTFVNMTPGADLSKPSAAPLVGSGINGGWLGLGALGVAAAGGAGGGGGNANPADSAAPKYTSNSASVNGNQLKLVFDENLLANAPPLATAFEVLVDNQSVEVTDVQINGATVVLTLKQAVTANQVVSLRYTDPSSGNDAQALQDAAGNDVASLSTTVTNTTPVIETVIEGNVVAGPFTAAILFEVFDSKGNLLSRSVSDDMGKVKITLPSAYTGLVLVRASSANGTAVDYVDEKSGQPVNLETPLRAYVLVTAGTTTSLTVTPLTEMAVRKGQLDAGQSADSTVPPSAQAAMDVNADVARKFNLTSINGPVTPIIGSDGKANPAYNESDGLNAAAEAYGRVLAKVSSNNIVTGSTAQTLDAYVSALRQGDAALVAELLEQGAKSFEYGGNTQTAGYANLLNPTLLDRVLSAPLRINHLAAERATGVQLLSDGGSNPQADNTLPLSDKQINLTESSDGKTINLPVALPVQALAGDTLTLTVPATQGGNAYTISRTITAAEAGAGFALVALAGDALRATGDGAKRMSATLTGPASSAPGASQVSIRYDLLTFGSDADNGMLSVDTTAPAQPTVQLDAGNAGTPGSGVTTNLSPRLSGTGEVGNTIDVFINGKTYSTTVDSSGNWHVDITDPLPASAGAGTVYAPQITATDAVGNKTTVIGTPFSVVLHVNAGLAHTPASDTGSSSSDNITNNPTPVIEGQVPGETTLLKVLVNGVVYSSDASSSGLQITLSAPFVDAGVSVRSFSFTAQALPHSNGSAYVPVLSVYRGAVLSTFNGTPFEVDLQAPSVQSIGGGLHPDAINDTGLSSFDGLTNNATPTLSGAGEPGAKLSVAIQNDAGSVVQTLTGTVGTSGLWSLPVTTPLSSSGALGALGQSYTPVITLTDAAGNSTTRTGRSFTLDKAAPTVNVSVSTSQGDDATLFSGETATLSFSFSEDPGSSFGLDDIVLRDGSTDLSATQAALYGTFSNLSGTGLTRTALFTPAAGQDKTLQVGVKALSFVDMAGNENSAASTDGAVNALTLATSTPKVTGVSLQGLDGQAATAKNLLSTGDVVQIQVAFDSPIRVTGTPEFVFDLGGVSKKASYVSTATDGQTLLFRYTVAQGDNDNSGGITYMANALLPGVGAAGTGLGSITSLAGNHADFSTLSNAGNQPSAGYAANSIQVDTTAPTVTLTTTDADLNLAGKTTQIQLSFSELPDSTQLTLSDLQVEGGGSLLNDLQRVDNSNNYTVTYQAPDNTQSGGTHSVQVKVNAFVDAAGNSNALASNVLTLNIDTVAPTVGLSRLDSGTLNSGAVAQLQLNFSEIPSGFSVSDIVLDATLGSIADLVQVDAKSYTFKFIPKNGLGQQNVPIRIDSNAFTDAAGNPNLDSQDANNLVDIPVNTLAPTVQGVVFEGYKAGASSPTTATLVAGDEVRIKVQFTSPIFVADGSPGFEFQLDNGSSRTASFVSSSSGSSSLIFSYAVAQGDTDKLNGLTAQANRLLPGSATLQDALGNHAFLATQAIADGVNAIAIDTTAPTVLVQRSGTGTLNSITTETIRFVFSEDPGNSFLWNGDTTGANAQTGDITIGGSGGSLGPLTKSLDSQGRTVFSGVFTPAPGQTTSATFQVSAGRFTDPANNSNLESNLLEIPVNTVALPAPTGALKRDTANDTGSSQTDNLTSNLQPVLAGTALAGTTVQVMITVGGQERMYEAQAQANNTWELKIDDALSDAETYAFTIVSKDSYNNTSTAAGKAFTIDASAPARPSGGLKSDAINDTAGVGIGATDDNHTANRKPQLIGKAEVGSAVKVLLNGQSYDTTADSTGQWTLTLPDGRDLPKGDYTPQIISIDAAGNSSQANGTVFTVDYEAPSAQLTTARLQPVAGNDTGILGDHLTANTQPVIGGTAESGSLVVLTIDNRTYTAIAASDNTWAITIGSGNNTGHSLAQGGYAMVVTATDKAGNMATGTATDFSVQGASGDPTLSLANDTAISGTNNDKVTKDTRLAITGIEGGSIVQYRVVQVAAGSSEEVMDWSDLSDYTTTMASQPDGTYTVYVRQQNTTGVYSAGQNGLTFTKDTTAAPLTVSLFNDSSNGLAVSGIANNEDKVTNDPSLSVSAPEMGGKVQYSTNGTTWSDTYSAPTTPGAQTVWARQIDPAGNASAPTAFSFIVDNLAPATANITGRLRAADGDSGIAGDQITNITTPWLTGTAEPNAKVVLGITLGSGANAMTKTYSGSSDANGAWSLQITDALGAGHYTPTLLVMDAAGNSTTAQALQAFTVDTRAPQVIVSGMPAQMKAGDSATITFSFSEDPGSSFSKSDISVTHGSITTPQVDLNDPTRYTAVFTPTAGLASGSVSVSVASGSFQDAAGNLNADGSEADNTSTGSLDTLAPTISSVSMAGVVGLGNSGAGSATNKLTVGDLVEVSVVFSEVVNVSDGGVPTFNIALNNNAVRTAEFVSGSGTNTLKFHYTVVAGDTDNLGGITALANSMGLPSGVALRDNAGNDAILSSLAVAANANLVRIDTTAPTLTLSRDDSNLVLNSVNSATVRFSFSEVPTGFAQDDIVIGGSGGAIVANSFTKIDDLNYTIEFLPAANTKTPASISVNAGRLVDSHGNSNAASNDLLLAVDTQSLMAPTGQIDASADTGNGEADTATDQITQLAKPRLIGLAEKGSSIEVSLLVNGDTKTYTTSASSITGAWTVDVTDTLQDGVTYTPSVKSTNLSGNSVTANITPFTVDLTAPLATGVSGELRHDATFDTGSDTNDSYTNNSQVQLVGTAEAGARVEVTLGSHTYNTVADVNGAWSITATTTLADNTYIPSIKVIDRAGNATVKNGTALTIDTERPLSGGITGALGTDAASDTGTQGDNLTGSTTPTIAGFAERSARVEVLINNRTYTTTASSTTGAWRITVGDASHPGHALGAGTWDFSITATDKAGNSQSVNGTPFTVQTAGVDPLIRLVNDSTNGADAVFASDFITNNPAVQAYNTVADSKGVEFKISSGPGGANGTGSDQWKNTADYNAEMAALADGTYTIHVRQYDAANVASVGTRSISVTKDTSAAALSVALANDVGNGLLGSTTDRVTSDGALSVSAPELGGIVQYSTDNRTWSSTYVAPLSDAPNGATTVFVRQLDKAGNASAATAFTYNFDTTAPDVNAITGRLLAGNLGDTGADSTDNLTQLRKPSYSGSAEPNARVDVQFTGNNGQTVNAVTTASPLGVWSVTPEAELTGSSYTTRIMVTDAAGNVSTTAGTGFSIDTLAPTVALGMPDTGSQVQAGETVTLTLTFSEDPGSSLSAADLQVIGGTVSDLRLQTADQPLVYLVDFSPSNNFEGTASIAIASNRFTDAAGNDNSDGAQANNRLSVQVDTLVPKLNNTTANAIGLSGQSWDGSHWIGKTGTLVAGDAIEVAVQFTEAVLVSGTPEFYITLNNSTSRTALYDRGSNSSTLYFRYVIQEEDNDTLGGVTALANSLSLGADESSTITDLFGNTAVLNSKAVLSGSNTLGVDTTHPEVLISSDLTALNAESGKNTATLTFTFSEDPGNTFSWNGATSGLGAQTGSITVSGGTLGELSGSGRVRTAIFTPTPDSATIASVHVAAGAFQDAARNDNTASNTVTLAVDTERPSVAIGSEALGGQLKAGESCTITFDFSEDPGNSFVLQDIAVTGGTLSNLSGTGSRRTATFTPQADFSGLASVKVVNQRFEDAAGNLNHDGVETNNTLELAIDTVRPSVAITGLPSVMGQDQTATITFSFSEDPGSSFDVNDLLITGGSISGLSTSGTTRTAIFTPNVTGATGGAIGVAIASGKFADAAGNLNNDGAEANNSQSGMADLVAPEVVISADPLTLNSATTCTITLDFSEVPTGFTWDANDVTVEGGGTLSQLQPVLGNPLRYTGTYTPPADTQAGGTHTVQVRLGAFKDAAGNASSANSNTLTFSVDTAVASLSDTALDLLSGSDSGSSTDNWTQVASPVITLSTLQGKAFLAGDQIDIIDTSALNAVVGRYTVQASDLTLGLWNRTTLNIALDAVLSDASHALVARISDTAGNLGASTGTPLVVTIDTTAPITTVSGVQFSQDTGISASDHVINQANQNITATLSAHLLATDVLQGSVDGGTTWTDITSSVNNTAIAWQGATLSGASSVAFRITDQAGNVGANTGATSYVLDNTAPADIDLNTTANGVQSSQTAYINRSALGLTAFYSIGTDIAPISDEDIAQIKIVLGSPNDNAMFLSNGSLTIGTTSDFSLSSRVGNASDVPVLVNYSASNRTLTMSSSSGSNFTAAQVVDILSAFKMFNTPQSSNQGAYTFTFTTLDRACNESASATQTVVIDVTAPDAPSLSLATDSGNLSTDRVTNMATINVGGLEAGASWEYQVGSGTWTAGTGTSFTATAGSNTYAVRQTDAAGNLGSASSALTLDYDATGPSVSSVAISSATGRQNSMLNAGDVVSVTVTMSEATTVTGTPTLGLKIGGTTVQASYASGSGTAALVFNCTILAAQTDANGISVNANSLALAGGTLKDAAGNDATLTHSAVTDNASFMVDTTAPSVTVSGVQFSQDTGISTSDFVTGVANQNITATLGAPLLSTDVLEGSVDGGTTWTDITSSVSNTAIAWQGATLSGASSVVFRVTDQAGNVGANTGATSYVLDDTAPTALDLNATAIGIQSSQTAYINRSALGTYGNYSIGTNFASITDSDVSQIKIVLTSPNYDYTGFKNGNLVIGSSLNYSLASEAGTLNVLVRVSYTVSNRTLIVSPSSGSSFTAAQVVDILSSLKMYNTPQSNTEGTYTFTFTTLDRVGNESASATQTVVIDVTAPTAPSLSLATDSGNLNNDAITKLSTINVSGLEVGASWAYQVGSGAWTAGTGTSFAATAGSNTYTVRQTDAAGNLGTVSSALTVDYDATAPTVSGVAITSATGVQNSTLNAGDVVSVTVTMSEATTVTGTPTLGLNIGGTTVQASYASGSGTTALVFNYTLLAGQTDADGISVEADSLALAGGTLTDDAGNDATLTHSAVTDNASYKVDTAAPTLSSTKPSISYTSTSLNAALPITPGNSLNDTIKLTLTFDGQVNGLTSGTDSTIFKVAGSGVSAVWAGTAGSNTRTLTYTLSASQNGQATIDEAALLNALSSGITDAAGNAFSYTANNGSIPAIDSSPLPVVDTTAPDAVDLTATAGVQATHSYTVSSSEASAGKSIASNIQAPTASDIYAIQLVLGGANLDTLADKLVFNGSAQNLAQLGASVSNVSLGGVAVNYSYLAETKSFIITQYGGGAFDPAKVDDIVNAILFKTTSTNEGERTITLR